MSETETTEAAVRLGSGRALTLDERYPLEREALGTRAVARLAGAGQDPHVIVTRLSRRALKSAIADEFVNPNDPATFRVSEDHATFLLRRHGQSLHGDRLVKEARETLITEQARIDDISGLDWCDADDSAFARALADANAQGLPIDLDAVEVWSYLGDRRVVAAKKLGISSEEIEDLSRWAVDHLATVDLNDPTAWRVGCRRWAQTLEDRLGPLGDVEAPIGVFVMPARGGDWCCAPVLSVDMMRLINEIGGKVSRDLQSAEVPGEAGPQIAARVANDALAAPYAEKEAESVASRLGAPVSRSAMIDDLYRWGRLSFSRWEHNGAVRISLRVATDKVKAYPTRRFGAHSAEEKATSNRLGLGEVIDHAIDAGVPVVLSSEAAGELGDKPRVGRMKGRPGRLTITQADSGQITSRRIAAEHLPAALRELRDSGEEFILDSGAFQSLRMTMAKPLADDPILLPPQRKVTAMMVVGSGLNASATGAGKTVMTLRSVYHRAETTPRFRAMMVAEGRLTLQWQREMLEGDPARGMPPLCPNVTAVVLNDRESVAAQVRRADREAGGHPLVILCPDGVLDRHAADLQVTRWHLLVADEVLRYANTATDAHRAIRQVRRSAEDCWLLSATPKGRTAEHLDVLVGLALDDDSMITSKINVREGGDLLIERNAARVRANYGPHLVRVTKQQMASYMPEALPAEALPVEPDDGLIELLEAIREGGREAYRIMRELIARIEGMGDAPEEQIRAARAELAKWQGMVLGNVGVYVAASVDPEALLSSDAVLAKALKQKGIIEKAMTAGGNGMPLLRSVVAESLARISVDEQIIVFCDRVVPLRRLADAVRQVHGVDARVADGTVHEDEFDSLKSAFQAGEFPILCLSRVGQKGHNLQGASSILHYDLPWLDVDLEQRVGRAVRAGSKHSYVSSYIPYIKGAGIEHVVSMLAPRGAEGHNLLDGFEGVTAKQSVVAGQLGEITKQVSQSKDQEGRKKTGAKLRVAAAVFGRA